MNANAVQFIIDHIFVFFKSKYFHYHEETLRLTWFQDVSILAAPYLQTRAQDFLCVESVVKYLSYYVYHTVIAGQNIWQHVQYTIYLTYKYVVFAIEKFIERSKNNHYINSKNPPLIYLTTTSLSSNTLLNLLARETNLRPSQAGLCLNIFKLDFRQISEKPNLVPALGMNGTLTIIGPFYNIQEILFICKLRLACLRFWVISE